MFFVYNFRAGLHIEFDIKLFLGKKKLIIFVDVAREKYNILYNEQ